MEHRHVWASGWIANGKTFRECTVCREGREYTGKRVRGQIKTDFNYYKSMAAYYGIK